MKMQELLGSVGGLSVYMVCGGLFLTIFGGIFGEDAPLLGSLLLIAGVVGIYGCLAISSFRRWFATRRDDFSRPATRRGSVDRSFRDSGPDPYEDLSDDGDGGD